MAAPPLAGFRKATVPRKYPATPGTTPTREDALRLLTELGDVQGRPHDLKRRLPELAEEP